MFATIRHSGISHETSSVGHGSFVWFPWRHDGSPEFGGMPWRRVGSSGFNGISLSRNLRMKIKTCFTVKLLNEQVLSFYFTSSKDCSAHLCAAMTSGIQRRYESSRINPFEVYQNYIYKKTFEPGWRYPKNVKWEETYVSEELNSCFDWIELLNCYIRYFTDTSASLRSFLSIGSPFTESIRNVNSRRYFRKQIKNRSSKFSSSSLFPAINKRQ